MKELTWYKFSYQVNRYNVILINSGNINTSNFWHKTALYQKS